MDRIFNLGASFIVLLIVTTMLLPNRQTVGVSNSLFNGIAKVSKAGLGQG